MRRRNLLIFIAFLLVAGGVVASQFIFGWSRGTLLNPVPPLEISINYSSELREWLEPAVNDFNGQNRKVGDQPIKVTIEAVDDGEAMRGILSGSRKPTAWIPASTIWVNLLNEQWRPTHQTDLLLRSGEYGTTPLALTPMVFVMFDERAKVFTASKSEVDWLEIQEAVTAPTGWSALGGNEAWGRVKYGQPNPSTSNAGLLAVTLASQAFYGKTTALSLTDLDDEAYVRWIEGLASGLVDQPPFSAQQQINELLQFGPSRYDVVCIYESLVVQQMKNAQPRFGTELRVFYPGLNIWSDYPFSILMDDSSSAEQKDAALVLMRYLYSPRVQEGALRAGFRPANPDVALLTGDAENPFNKYKNAGLLVNIPRTVLADIPQGNVLTRLMGVLNR
jgi:ABC-type Fe3+ transport system substrate-binding protein